MQLGKDIADENISCPAVFSAQERSYRLLLWLPSPLQQPRLCQKDSSFPYSPEKARAATVVLNPEEGPKLFSRLVVT